MSGKKRNSPLNISVLTLGCSKNVVDSETIIGNLISNGFNVVEAGAKADAMIINTCGFIGPAKEESINVILQAAELKRKGKIKSLIVSGCLSQRYNEDLRSQIPEVDYFFGVAADEQILKALKGDDKYDLIGERSLLTPKHFAYLKISEGCNHECSFCAIPLIRGKHYSKPVEKILDEAATLAKAGTKEFVVIAQDTTWYGRDLYGHSKLASLLRGLSDIEGVEWARLMYAYPVNFPYEALDVIAERPNLCNYIDIPLQHGSDKILKSMKRGITRSKIEDLVGRIRNTIEGAAIRSTFIVGYPGETENDFNELLDMINILKLDRVGVFQYSREEDTSAYILGDPVPQEVKAERAERFMLAQQQISLEKNKAKTGKKFKVIIDQEFDGKWLGRTEFDAPEVDNGVLIDDTRRFMPGEFITAEIYNAEEYDLYGKEVID